MPTPSTHAPDFPPAWAARTVPQPPQVAVLLTGCIDAASSVRGYRTMLPRAEIYLYGADLPAEAVAAAEGAGARVRAARPMARTALVRRMFAEVEADIYILSHEPDGGDICAAPRVVAEIEDGGKDLVGLSRFEAPSDIGDRLLSRTVDFLFGGGGDAALSDSKACSRRFAKTYGGDAHPAMSPGLGLALHALRLRMPVGEVSTLGRLPATGRAPRGVAGWLALLGLVARLLVEERPRRILGLMGLAVVAAGIAAALPGLTLQGGRATLAPGSAPLPVLAVLALGGGVMAAGVVLDTLAKARQEVKRLGYLAIPRRSEDPRGAEGPGWAGPTRRQSSVS